jgi:hypothetical protein
MKGNLYQHIKIRHAYDFSLCFPHEFLMSFWIVYKYAMRLSWMRHEILFFPRSCWVGIALYFTTTAKVFWHLSWEVYESKDRTRYSCGGRVCAEHRRAWYPDDIEDFSFRWGCIHEYPFVLMFDFVGVVFCCKSAQVVTNLQQTCSDAVATTCQQDVFALLVPSLLTTCYEVIELNRLVTSCSNNLLSSFNSTLCQKIVSDNLVATWQNNSIVTTCWQACYKPVVNTSCRQVVSDNLVATW